MTEHIAAEVQSAQTISEVEKILGVGTNYTPEYVLKCFDITYQVKEENNELDDIGIFIDAKNQLLRHLVSSQMKSRRYFEIKSPFENTCVACRGSGEIYKFNRKTVLINCHICGGKKTIKESTPCEKCDGTGRFKTAFKGGGGIDVSCLSCGGKKETVTISKCSECLGTGKKQKVVADHTIKSTTPCKHCRQLGFTKDKPEKKVKKRSSYTPANPVLTMNLAKQIKEFIPPEQK